MPVEQLTNQQGGLGTILGMVGGYLAENPARKAAKEQQDYTRKRQTAEDDRAQKQLGANIQEETDRHKGFEDQQGLTQRETAANATIHQTLGPEPTYDPNNPGPYLAYATKAASYFRNQGLAQTATGKGWQDEANKIPQGYQQFTGGQKNVASAGLDKERTQFIKNYAINKHQEFLYRMKELQATEQGRALIAQGNQAAAFARAQLSQSGANGRAQLAQSGANNRAQMGEDERNAIAEATAVNAMNRQGAAQAYSSAMKQYSEAETNWRQRNAASAAAPDSAPAPGPEPTINNYLPQGQSGGNTTTNTTTNTVWNVVQDPRTGKPTVVQYTPPHDGGGGGGGGGGRPSASQVVSKARAKGRSDDAIRAALQADGYPPNEISAALGGGSSKPSGPIQGLNLRGGAPGGQSGFSVKGIFGQ